ncbi:hypothetical protein YC2023_073495 [Brassica napus]
MQREEAGIIEYLTMREEVERTLTDPQRDEFEDMLRALTLERSQIKEAIGFALDNADAAEEISSKSFTYVAIPSFVIKLFKEDNLVLDKIRSFSSKLKYFLIIFLVVIEFLNRRLFPLYIIQVVEVLTESLTLKETSIPTKVARLLLVSDILHNSSVPVKNASAYRTKFEAAVPDIMESFNDLYRSITGRITAEALKVHSQTALAIGMKCCYKLIRTFLQERVLKVLQVWADWFLFSDAYIYGLRATFLRSGTSGVTSFHSLCGDEPEIEKKGYIDNLSDIINPDTALAIGKGAARQELMDFTNF